MTKTNLKNIVRKRRAKTGESYQKALEAVRILDTPPVCEIAFCHLETDHGDRHGSKLGPGPRKNPFRDVVADKGDPYAHLAPMVVEEHYCGDDSSIVSQNRAEGELFVVPDLVHEHTKLHYISAPLRWYVGLPSPITQARLHNTLSQMRVYGCSRVLILWDVFCNTGVIGWAKSHKCSVCGLVEGPLGNHHCVKTVPIVGHGESREIAVERDLDDRVLNMAPVKGSERAWLDLQLPNGHVIKAQVTPEDYRSYIESVRTENSRT